MNHQNCTFISKNKDCNEAIAITLPYPACCGNTNPKPSKKGPDCWHCGESGHIHCDCRKPKRKPLTAQSESANQVSDNLDKPFGINNIESDAESMPELESVCDSNEFNDTRSEAPEDWFSDEDSDWVTSCDAECVTNELSGVNSECSSFVDIDPESVVPAANKIAAAVANEHSENRAELYDSRTTHHISPYHKMFKNYTSTPPKSLSATNNGRLVAIGKEDMVIEVPNGVHSSQLRLTEALISPEVRYTLVLIGRLDKCRYTMTFSSSQCMISNNHDYTIGQVPRSLKVVYKVVHDGPELTCEAEDTVTWTKLHRRMGHVSQGVTKQLAEKGLVTGVCIDTSSSGIHR